MRGERVLWLSIASVVVLGGVAVYGLYAGMSDRFGFDYGLTFDAFFLALWLLFFYYLYETIGMRISTFLLVLGGMGVHLLGDFYFYGKRLGLLEFDMILHAYWGLVLFFIMRNFLGRKIHASWLVPVAVLSVLGLSVLHEMLEFFGYYLIGEGTGIFMYGAGDFGEYNDVMFDLISNLVGAAVGALVKRKQE